MAIALSIALRLEEGSKADTHRQIVQARCMRSSIDMIQLELHILAKIRNNQFGIMLAWHGIQYSIFSK